MAALATEHLTDIQRQTHVKHLARDIQSRTIPPELARLTHTLTRYYDQIADGFGSPRGDDTDVRDAARRASARLRQAERLLGPPAQTEAPRSILAQKLRATSIALGCGLDLLSTNFPVTTDQVTSVNAAVITTPEAARSLLHQVSVYTTTLSHLVSRTKTPVNRAASPLLRAAVIAHAHSLDHTSPTIAAVSLHHAPDRIPPVLNEDNGQSLVGINGSIQRLSGLATDTSVPTWRYLARAATIICDLNHKIVQQLIYRLEELDNPDHIPALQQAKASIRHTSTAWKSIIQKWDEYVGHYGHPAYGPATDASDLIIRLGRRIHADPAWTPSPRASPRVRPPHELATDLAQAADLIALTVKTTEACNIIASYQTVIIDVAATGVLNRQKNPPIHRSQIALAAESLVARSDAAQSKGRQAITTLVQAIQNLEAPPTSTSMEMQLALHRADILTEQEQAKLAASEFPGSPPERPNNELSSPDIHSKPNVTKSFPKTNPIKR
ncbi:hypothetical protein [Actinomadura meridiana]